jgi:peptide/nickel transport system substrate-binding protein
MIGFTRQTIIEMIRSELGKMGISLDVKLFNNWEEHDRAIKSDSAQMFIDSYGSDVLGDAHDFLYSLFHSKSAINSLHYARDNVDQWLDAACREADEQVRQEIYEKVVQQVLQDVPAVFLFHVKPHFAYNRRKIKKMVVNPYQIIQFHRLELYE